MAGPVKGRPFLFSPDGEGEGLAESAESAERFSPDDENEVTQKARKAQKWRPSVLCCFAALGHTDGTDDTDRVSCIFETRDWKKLFIFADRNNE